MKSGNILHINVMAIGNISLGTLSLHGNVTQTDRALYSLTYGEIGLMFITAQFNPT